MPAIVRRVITGETDEGVSVFAKVQEAEPLLAAIAYYGVWGWDHPVELPVNPVEDYVPKSLFPAPGGVRVTVIEFPAGSDVDSPRPTGPDSEKLRAIRSEGGRVTFEDRATGMHATNSIEIGFVISGEIGLEQDDGVEVTLRPGDVLVQNGARHAWRNRGSVPCLMGFVVLGASRTTPGS